MSNFLRFFVSAYHPRNPVRWAYMLQQVEYEPARFAHWLKRLPNFNKVMRRQKLVKTKNALLLVLVSLAVKSALIFGAIYLALNEKWIEAVAAFLLVPWLAILSLFIVCWSGNILLKIKRKNDYANAKKKLSNHKALKIAVLGSYGKTTMKEVLATVLSEGKKVAATPGNKNVAISHARWINSTIAGDEEVLVFEYGEFRPGDIKELAKLTMPDMAIITGVAPNHLENYASFDELKNDLKTIREFVKPENLLVHESTAQQLGLAESEYTGYDDAEVLGWKISGRSNSVQGLRFNMEYAGRVLELESSIVGEHLIPALAIAAAVADRIGLSLEQIAAGVSKTKPFDHRMQPYQLNGAWVIDDTYNGNLEGVRKGLELLSKTEAKRKIYVTPGLVEQGSETEAVHKEIGSLIAKANPDIAVLMENSVQPVIEESLKNSGFNGEIRIERDPLNFYQNLQYFVADGDLILMQNDWTDNYS